MIERQNESLLKQFKDDPGIPCFIIDPVPRQLIALPYELYREPAPHLL